MPIEQAAQHTIVDEPESTHIGLRVQFEADHGFHQQREQRIALSARRRTLLDSLELAREKLMPH